MYALWTGIASLFRETFAAFMPDEFDDLSQAGVLPIEDSSGCSHADIRW